MVRFDRRQKVAAAEDRTNDDWLEPHPHYNGFNAQGPARLPGRVRLHRADQLHRRRPAPNPRLGTCRYLKDKPNNTPTGVLFSVHPDMRLQSVKAKRISQRRNGALGRVSGLPDVGRRRDHQTEDGGDKAHDRNLASPSGTVGSVCDAS